MRSITRAMVAGLAVLASATAVTVAGPAARATTDGPLPLPGFGDMVVDDVHDRVFVSGGPASNSVVVTDFSGRVKKTINGQSGANGLVLSADSKTLYVALASGDAISAIDTTKFTETARFPVGPQTCPTHLARTGTVVWFGYGCESDWAGKIGRLDTAALPAPVVTLDQQGDVVFQRAPLVSANGTDAGPLVAGQLSLSLSTVQVYGVADGKLTAGATGDVVGASLADLNVSADGTTLFSASGSRDRAEAFAPGDLSRRGAYATGTRRPAAVAASPDNAFVAIGTTTSGKGDVLVYAVGASTPKKSVDLPRTDTVAPRGLAWTADQKKLFVVSQRANEPEPTLVVVSNPTK